MSVLLFFVLFAASAFGVVWAWHNPTRLIQFPAIISGVMLAYILPQIWPVARGQGRIVVPDTAYDHSMIYASLCLFAAYLGYMTGRVSKGRFRVVYDAERLFRAGAVVLLFGALGYLAANLSAGGWFGLFSSRGAYAIEWRGAPVYYLFLGRLLLPGLVLCFIAVLLRPAPWKWVVITSGLMYPLAAVLFLGRRSMLIGLGAYCFVVLFFIKAYLPSRVLVFGGLCVASLAIILLPAYRGNMAYDADRDALTFVNPREVVHDYLDGNSYQLAAIYGMLGIGAYDRIEELQWGGGFWNALVDQFVPRIAVGEGAKEALKIDPGDAERRIFAAFGQDTPFYLVIPGILGTFWEFGYLGCILFFGAGRIWKRVYVRAARERDMRAMVFYSVFFLVPAMLIYGRWEFLFGDNSLQLLALYLVDRYARRRVPAAVMEGGSESVMYITLRKKSVRA